MTSTPEQREKRRLRRLAKIEQYRAAAKAYREKNREKVQSYQKQYNAEYHAKNHERLNAQSRIRSKEHYYANRDKYLAKGKAWRKANPEKLREHVRNHRARNPELIRQQARERDRKRIQNDPAYRERRKRNAALYRKRHLDRVIERVNKRRALQKGATAGDLKVIAEWKRAWKKRTFVTCYWCGVTIRSKDAVADHIEALANKGRHAIENLCISCRPCNGSKHALPMTAWNGRLREPVLL